MAAPSSDLLPALRQLRLDDALALLEQAGALLPDAEPYSIEWLQAIVDALADLSNRDPLSGLVNRRSFEMTLEREMDRVARSGEPALLLMIDIDHFKRVNDTHGHAAGIGSSGPWRIAWRRPCAPWIPWHALAARSSPRSCPTALPVLARRWPSAFARL